MLMERAGELIREHQLSAVFVGIAGKEGDLLVPEFIAFVEASLRVEDRIFVLTRERAVLLLTDVTLGAAESVLERVRGDFAARFPAAADLQVSVRFHEVNPRSAHPTAKEILPGLFSPDGSPQVS
jgi:hypothetical protein